MTVEQVKRHSAASDGPRPHSRREVDFQILRHATVHDIVTLFPETKAVLLQNGYDLCCNALLTVEAQAKKKGLSSKKVLDELKEVLGNGR